MFSPFRGSLFDPSRVPSPEAATAPPYDVIDPPAKQLLLGESPYNLVRVLLPEPGPARYQRAGRLLREWLEDGILVTDPDPALYLYSLEHRWEGETQTALGVLGSLRLDPAGRRVVPHEETMATTEEDRLRLLRSTGANLDPIVVLSSSPRLGSLLEPEGPPILDFQVDEARHRLYRIADSSRIEAVGTAVSSHRAAIADGHHRYATALRYREERRAVDGTGPWDDILAFVTPADREGLQIGPIHRRFDRIDLPRLNGGWRSEPGPAAPPSDPGRLVLVPGEEWESAPLHLTPPVDSVEGIPAPWRVAGAALARLFLYPRLGVEEAEASYFPRAEAALGGIPPRGGAVLLAPIPRSAVVNAIEQGIRFPQKSTFFAPKPRAGLVLRIFD